MKRIKSHMQGSRLLKATRIEIHNDLSEKFGSSFEIPQPSSDQEHKMNFQLDRLFSIIHDN